jgi:hypothetical protein
MQHAFSRRNLLRLAPLGVPWPKGVVAAPVQPAAVPDSYPMQAPAMVREMVGVAHGNMKRVRELVEARPTLAKAAWDWGFGDWETALGAASHTGNREIAEYLMSRGARPTLFSATMLGHLDVVKAFLAAQPGAQRIPGPHGISLLAHAKAGGAASGAVLSYLESLGDAGSSPAVPLGDDEITALKGTYAFGGGPADRIEITVVRGQLFFARVGMQARGLYHVGDHAFYPAGATAVRIRFAASDTGMSLTVHDPDLVLAANRV